ncbi:MAG: hypothetical protein KBF43_09060 [Dermatophilaceae bacterium]|nr:hypothetical protein [Dermatophilaceae bacterium]MBP9918721.1 hypothetical protein [Dermatophilaceae bacterium]
MTIIAARYGPDGKPLIWWDTTDRTRHDMTSGYDTVTPFTASENALADEILARQAALDNTSSLRAQLEAGIAAILVARNAAQADIATAQAMQAGANTYKDQAQALAATAFTATPTYSQEQIQALADALKATANRQAIILEALANSFGWRAGVDGFAVNTDDRIIWLSQRAAANLT